MIKIISGFVLFGLIGLLIGFLLNQGSLIWMLSGFLSGIIVYLIVYLIVRNASITIKNSTKW